MSPVRRQLALLLPALALARTARVRAADDEVIVFAAASLTDVLRQIATEGAFSGVSFSFGSSSTLARQIQQGAPAQMFISADEPWMEAVVQSGQTLGGTRRSLAGNRLALVQPGGSEPAEPPETAEAVRMLVADALANPSARIAAGDPAHVPAGIYAKAALGTLGLWATVEPRLARADNVRAALALVERGESPLGIVYRTDALQSGKVRVAALFPAASHPPIRYPVALLQGAGPAARRFYDYLFGISAQSRLRAAGFQPI
jgi:molybdate transport system substrate-binding protein